MSPLYITLLQYIALDSDTLPATQQKGDQRTCKGVLNDKPNTEIYARIVTFRLFTTMDPFAAQRNQANLRSIARSDPAVQEILETSVYSTIYHFTTPENGGEGEWVKQKAEGPTFIVRRYVVSYLSCLAFAAPS